MSFETNSTESPRRLSVEELPAKPKKMQVVNLMEEAARTQMLGQQGVATLGSPSPTPAPPNSSSPDPVLIAFKALGFAASARAMLMLSLLGAFPLAVMAMRAQTLATLEVLAVYGIFVILPVVYLEIHKRPTV